MAPRWRSMVDFGGWAESKEKRQYRNENERDSGLINVHTRLRHILDPPPWMPEVDDSLHTRAGV